MGWLASRETTTIRLEASTICQLKCPICPTTQGLIKEQLGSGFLKFDAFRRIVDENPWVHAIELSNWGEIFLNPEIERILAYAYRRSVALTAWNGANLNHVKEPVLEALARYKFRGITCSIDGVTNETYEAYRRMGNVERVFENIRKINAYKRRWKTRYPKLRWQMIAFGHNAHEVAPARALASELGMEFFLKANADPSYSPVEAEEPAATTAPDPIPAAATGSPSDADPVQGHDLTRTFCLQLWEQPQINFDGKLLGCCVNSWGSFGDNVLEVGLDSALAGERLAYAKRMLQGTAPARDDVPCTACATYVGLAASKQWIEAPPPPPGVAGFLKRHGMGRTVVWINNRFGRQLLPVLERLHLA
jgi:hypothetical protein